ncbi:Para-nitrobenzyl esterase [Papilio machaon]|uniref:Carboxylic ester hydrolase n=1 Tax=Papilio machaon TaxID=76193 RepID=A0A194RCV5_PAPMA|nr:Para-nitrobenzyl esterase [Papilio machaon]
MLKWIIFLALILVAIGESKEVRQLNIAQGPVRGYKDAGDDVFVFYGIPYATAPTGPNKYKAPLPPPTWTVPFEAINKNIICPQMKYRFVTIPNSTQSEDCLIANIYVPDTKTNNKDYNKSYKLIKQSPKPQPIQILAPLPPPTWTAPFEATNKKIICPQTEDLFMPYPNSTQSEDCLIANIYVPDTKTKKLPVLVYVHGGAYQIGYGEFAVAKNLIREKEMIIVNFNYRLGPHGFLCLGTPDVPGNAGMKDQVALLRWVKKNIASFGGNPDDVTIIGYSAGSSAVDLLMLSPMTKGLFSKVIPESGSNMAVFSVQGNPVETAKAYAKFINFTGDQDDVYALERFYLAIDQLDEETNILDNIDYFTDVMFAYPTLRSVRLQVESGNNNFYLYQYDYVDDSAPLIPYTEIRGANHCAQTFGVIDGAWPNLTEDELSKDTKKMKQVMRKIWATFITTGKPVSENSDLPQWPPTRANGGPHMCIDKSLKLRGPLIQQRVLFWDEIYDKYYKIPTPPPSPPPSQKEEL